MIRARDLVDHGRMRVPRPVPLSLLLLAAACAPPGGSEAAELYRAHCSACHAVDGTGSALGLGPSLRGLRGHWDADSLLEYLANPVAYAAGDERLGARPMPGLAPELTPEERGAIVAHALYLMR